MIESHIIFDALKVVKYTAIAAYDLLGKKDEFAADQVAVQTMRQQLNSLKIDGKIIAGEGNKDNAPSINVGEKVGIGKNCKLDIALDPLEGTYLLSQGLPNSMSVIAFSRRNSMLSVPDMYMEKIAIGINYPEQIIDLNNTVKKNLQNLAKIKKTDISNIKVAILDRIRHKELISQVHNTGAQVVLIQDGDINAIIYTSIPKTKIDMYIGTGGSTEGILAAAALSTTGGQMCCKLVINNELEKKEALKLGIRDLNKQYLLNDLIKEDVIFASTGITKSILVNGIKSHNNTIITQTILMNSYHKEIYKINTYNKLSKKGFFNISY